MPYLTAAAAVLALSAVLVASIGAPESGLGKDPTRNGPLIARATDGAPVLAVFGDSVAQFLADDGMSPNARALGVTVLDEAHWSCAPLGYLEARDGNGPTRWEDCSKDMAASVQQLPVMPDVVMLMFGGLPYDVHLGGKWVGPCDPTYQREYRKAMRGTIDILRRIGRPVVLVGQVPMPSVLLQRNYGLKDASKRVVCLSAVNEKVALETGSRFVDLGAHVCDAPDDCDAVGPDRDLRSDGIHFRGAGAEAVATWLVPEVRKAAGL